MQPNQFTRREALGWTAGSLALGAFAPGSLAADMHPAALGIVIHSYGIRSNVSRERGENPPFASPGRFLDYCHELRAGGIQLPLGAPTAEGAKKLRAQAEQGGLYLEGSIAAPKNKDDVARFTAEVVAAKNCGTDVLRCALLNGRRYETFNTPDAFAKYKQDAWTSLTLAVPVVEQHGLKLAVENHKDFRSDELLATLKKLGSANVGVCLDTGNSIALLESPDETATALAPVTMTVHLKDMGMTEYEEGFLLSEVPLGEGFLNLGQIVATIRKANPSVRFNLEMITRDPLKIPCLTDKYWATLGELPARTLAVCLAMVRRHAAKQPLPRIGGLTEKEKLAAEDDHVRRSLKKWNAIR